LQSKGEKAEAFQQFVYTLLKKERKRTVDAIQLALKIEKTENEELRRAKALLQRSEANLFRVVNDEREKNSELTKEVVKLRKAKHAAADADYLRSMGRSHLIEEEIISNDESNEGDEGDEEE
jgi:uncharacterized protein (DUF305 family)